MPNENKSSIPVLPIKHWWLLRDQFRKSIPGTITTNYLSSVLGGTKNAARTNIMPSLRMIGLIDQDGKINQDDAKKFRDDDQYGQYCLGIKESIYPQEVKDAFPDANSERTKVINWFQNYTGVGISGARRMAAFYLLLCEADPEKKKEIKETPVKATRTKKVTKKEPKEDSSQEKETDKSFKQQRQTQFQQQLPDLNINIQVHVSSDATPDQIDQIFASMAKHLYNRKL